MTLTMHYVLVEGSGKLLFEVEGQGPGISTERRENLFLPFESLPINRDHPLDGTGLGLVLSQRLAEDLGGDLELVGSTVGKGGCFGFDVSLHTEANGH